MGADRLNPACALVCIHAWSQLVFWQGCSANAADSQATRSCSEGERRRGSGGRAETARSGNNMRDNKNTELASATSRLRRSLHEQSSLLDLDLRRHLDLDMVRGRRSKVRIARPRRNEPRHRTPVQIYF
eukprot:2348728-Pyramimonas_sp.AAC.1